MAAYPVIELSMRSGSSAADVAIYGVLDVARLAPISAYISRDARGLRSISVSISKPKTLRSTLPCASLFRPAGIVGAASKPQAISVAFLNETSVVRTCISPRSRAGRPVRGARRVDAISAAFGAHSVGVDELEMLAQLERNRSTSSTRPGPMAASTKRHTRRSASFLRMTANAGAAATTRSLRRATRLPPS